MQTDYELLIIGGGPAGLTAGIYALRANLRTVLLEKVVPGGQALITDWVENYPGFPDGISGSDLVDNMLAQAKGFGLKIENEEVLNIESIAGVKQITTEKRKISAAAVIIATGASPKKLGVSGESLFYGKGVSTCATCDGPFYKDKIVAAIGGGDTAVQESLFLAKFAKKVWLIHRRNELRATKILRERVLKNDKVEILWDSVVKEISGEAGVEKLTIENVKTGAIGDLMIDGCFIFTGISPNTDFLKNFVKMNEQGFIITDARQEASVPGVFCAGDAGDTPLRQIVTAAGNAAIAVTCAEHYIEGFHNE